MQKEQSSILCAANPYIDSLNITFRAKEWLSRMDTHLMNARQPKKLQHTHVRFFFLLKPCQIINKLCVGGSCGEDTSKIVFGKDQQHSQNEKKCVVYSIGGKTQWDFELGVLRSTSCQVYTFDGTGSKSRFQKPENYRLSFYHFCLGEASQPAPEFADNCSCVGLQKFLGHDQIDLFKMNIEG